MVHADQPTCFPRGLRTAVSSKDDGTMLDRAQDFHAEAVVRNRLAFCRQVGVGYEQCVYQKVQYGSDQTYTVVTEVVPDDASKHTPGVAADMLFTDRPGVGLFLPVADCVATIMYDPKRRYLAMLHLGRHSTYADLTTCATRYFSEKGSRPEDVIVWMSPHAGPASYSLAWFDRQDDPTWSGLYARHGSGYYLDLAGYNQRRLIAAGVLSHNITVSYVDTVTNNQYFSHSSGDVGGRIAVLAMMT